MKPLLAIFVFALLAGCNLAEKRFQREMAGYEKSCAAYFGSYVASDVAGAKKALREIIELSNAKQKVTTRYWRFNLMIAFSYARLAVIAEAEGNKAEALQLFSTASDFQLAQDRAFRAHLRSVPNVYSATEDSDEYHRLLPDQWRDIIRQLDRPLGVKWKKPNQTPEPTPMSVTPPAAQEPRQP
jgi:hypothetical protein